MRLLIIKDIYILGVRSKKQYFLQFFTFKIISVNNCLGHNSTKEFNYPLCIEELTNERCVDVSCGD